MDVLSEWQLTGCGNWQSDTTLRPIGLACHMRTEGVSSPEQTTGYLAWKGEQHSDALG